MVPDLDNTSARAISDLDSVVRCCLSCFMSRRCFCSGCDGDEYDHQV